MGRDSQALDAFAEGPDAGKESDFWSDFWSTTDDCVMLHHKKPRITLFVPDASSFPILLNTLTSCAAPTLSLTMQPKIRLTITGANLAPKNFQDYGMAKLLSISCALRLLQAIPGPKVV